MISYMSTINIYFWKRVTRNFLKVTVWFRVLVGNANYSIRLWQSHFKHRLHLDHNLFNCTESQSGYLQHVKKNSYDGFVSCHLSLRMVVSLFLVGWLSGRLRRFLKLPLHMSYRRCWVVHRSTFVKRFLEIHRSPQ